MDKGQVETSMKKAFGQSVLVLGGAGLVGRAVSKAILESGGKVLLADVHEEAAQDAALSLNLHTSTIHAVAVDACSEDSLKRLLATDLYSSLRVDSVVNCTYPKGPAFGRPVELLSATDFALDLSAQVGSCFAISKLFGVEFAARGGGHVLHFSSIYGLVQPRFDIYADTHMTMPVQYAASKSAIIHLTKYFAQYFKQSGVRYNAVAPGGIEDGQPLEFQERYGRHTQSQRLLSADEVAGVTLFLLSEAASQIDGQVIIVDDGWSL
jgi:NAD(P)-dependent dehydrogenase (short-subunit alcohol dehydrogenase family)